MKKEERIPIFYSCDDNFVKYTLVSLYSMIQNAARDRKYVVHILHTGISDKMKQQVRELEDSCFEICFEDVTEYLWSIEEKLPIRDYYSKTTYYRMFIAEMFPEYDKAIYIDSDTICEGDISELYDEDVEGCYVAAAREQAMLQTEVFGTYVEKVLGIERDQYFNAGVLLINCREFRQHQVLDQFVELLWQYDFVVTQDEDYLNLICRDKVRFLSSIWNGEVFGTLPVLENEICIIHYIMTAKPWHYQDCRLGEHFWKYAKETRVYEELCAVQRNYTQKEKAEDQRSAERLERTAQEEIEREDNYLNRRNSGRLKARDRLEVLVRIAKLEKEGKFDQDVEEDPPTKVLLPEDIDYLRRKKSSKIKTKLAYKTARVFLNTILDKKKLIMKEMIGIEHFQNLSSGAVITCNHFNALDSFAIQLVYEAAHQKKRKFYRVIREGNYTNFPGFYGMLMRNCNTFPLSSNMDTMKKFMVSMDTVLQNGHFMLIYPEQSMWWNYRKPKPLKKGAYTFAARNNVPVLPCFITMEDSDILDDDGFYVQEYTVHISEPIYPDPRKNQAQNVIAMRDKNYEVWKEIYEQTYHEPLTYSCDKGRNA